MNCIERRCKQPALGGRTLCRYHAARRRHSSADYAQRATGRRQLPLFENPDPSGAVLLVGLLAAGIAWIFRGGHHTNPPGRQETQDFCVADGYHWRRQGDGSYLGRPSCAADQACPQHVRILPAGSPPPC